MIAVSIANSRPDLLEIQRRRFSEHLDVGLLSAAHSGSRIPKPNIVLKTTRWRTWPEVYIDAVGQVLEQFDRDVFIVEGDIWPIEDINIESWPDVVMRKWAGQPYPGILFCRDVSRVYSFWRHIDDGWREIAPRIDCELLDWKRYTGAPCDGIDSAAAELIGDVFYHVNGGDRVVGAVGTEATSLLGIRRKVCKTCPHFHEVPLAPSFGCDLALHVARCYPSRLASVCPDSPPRW